MRLSAFHPLTALVYFTAVLAVTMFCFSPAVGICSAVGAFLFCAVTQSCRQTASDLAFYIFLTAVLTVTNPLFSHKGVTPLFFVNGKAYTKEALFYGLTAGLSLTAVIMWCKALGKGVPGGRYGCPAYRLWSVCVRWRCRRGQGLSAWYGSGSPNRYGC